MTPRAGVLMPGRGHISHKVKMNYFFTNIFPYNQAKMRQTNYKVVMIKEGSTKIINFMTPGEGLLWLGHISHVVKIHYFFKKRLLNTQA